MQNSPARRVLVVLNPASGAGITPAEWSTLRGHIGSLPQLTVVAETSWQVTAAVARQRFDAGVDAVIVRGGDGMVSFGVGLVADTEIPLGIVPAGSGNDFARAAGLSRNRSASVRSLIAGLTHPGAFSETVDALRLETSEGESWAANSVNFGFDSIVNERANTLKLPGSLRYLAAIAQVSREFSAWPMRIQLDDGPEVAVDATMLTLLNGRSIGGGIRLAPRADLADGLVDVVRIDRLPKIALPALFPVAAVGLHQQMPPAHFDRVHRVVAAGPADLPVYADGELRGRGGFRAELVPGAWRMLRPVRGVVERSA